MAATTAAVPHANTSRRRPLSASAFHSSKLYGFSSTFTPSARASSMSEARVIPGRIVPSGGVMMLPSSITKKTFMPPSSSTQRRSAASRNTT